MFDLKFFANSFHSAGLYLSPVFKIYDVAPQKHNFDCA